MRLGAGSAPDVSPGLPPQPKPARPPRALLPPLPHCYIPQRVSSAVRTASLLLWSNNFAWARLFRELVGSAGTQQLPPSFLLPLPAGTPRQPQAPAQQPPRLSLRGGGSLSLSPRGESLGFGRQRRARGNAVLLALPGGGCPVETPPGLRGSFRS